jgi:phosphonatase-like hydrolase
VNKFELVCFDMAGTTMIDSGLVLESFRRTIDELGVSGQEAVDAEAYVVETMGQSKIEVFTALFGDRASAANESFELHFVDTARDFGVRGIPGARAVVEELRSQGLKVALTTGFSPLTREVLIEELGWSDLFDLRVSPADAGRGRPAPDMLLWCALRLAVHSMDSLVVVGDTASDMQAGERAGAGLLVGVLSGNDDEERLRANGADEVLDSVAELLAVLEEPEDSSV